MEMNDELIMLAIIEGCIGIMTPEQQTEVADLVDGIRAVLRKASTEQVAAAALTSVGVMNLINSTEPRTQ